MSRIGRRIAVQSSTKLKYSSKVQALWNCTYGGYSTWVHALQRWSSVRWKVRRMSVVSATVCSRVRSSHQNSKHSTKSQTRGPLSAPISFTYWNSLFKELSGEIYTKGITHARLQIIPALRVKCNRLTVHSSNHLCFLWGEKKHQTGSLIEEHISPPREGHVRLLTHCTSDLEVSRCAPAPLSHVWGQSPR